MPETLKVLLLAAFQGVAEFLPISSSAHIAIIGDLAGANGRITDIEVSLHIGTLVSLCLFYRRRLAELLLAPIAHIREIVLIIVACVPAIIAYLVFDDALDEAFATLSPKVIGPMLMATGIALVSLAFRRDDGARPMCFWRALAIGVAQALALIPGVNSLENSLKIVLKEATVDAAGEPVEEVAIKFGAFIAAIITFLILALIVFLIVKAINKAREAGKQEEAPAAPTTKICPFCKSEIPLDAVRCPHCTSELPEE